MTYQPQPYQPAVPIVAVPTPPKRGLSTGAIVAIVAGAVMVLTCAICIVGGIINGQLISLNSSTDDPTRAGLGPAPTTAAVGHKILFEVTSPSGAATATLVNWSTLEDSAADHDQALPWSKEVLLETRSGLVGVTASVAGGRVACKLYVDGKLVDEGESDGVVNCSDTVGF